MKIITRKKWLSIPLGLIAIIAVSDYTIVSATHGTSGSVAITTLDNTVTDLPTEQIKVMTINMAHGRGNGRSQLLQKNDKINENVTAIGNLIAKEAPQVAALQEADAASWWSGNYSHVNTVGQIGKMRAAIQGKNVDGLGLHYGAAIVTQLNASNARQVTFDKNIPTFSKGFVVVSCEWPNDPSFKFDVISLHLDFANKDVREEQLSRLQDTIKQAKRPVIMMGDFNTDMSSELLPKFLSETGLTTWKADDNSIVTFPLLGSRIDWVLVSPEFEVVEQKVLDEVLSDHKIVTAMIKRQS